MLLESKSLIDKYLKEIKEAIASNKKMGSAIHIALLKLIKLVLLGKSEILYSSLLVSEILKNDQYLGFFKQSHSHEEVKAFLIEISSLITK